MAVDDPDPVTSVDALGFDHPDDPVYADLATDLRDRVTGDVRFDEYAQVLYATDGSIYGARPAGVVFPRDTGDVKATLDVAARHDAPVLPRGAGSSLAGQAVGPGCVVLDLSRHMHGILEVNPETQTATVQPGVVLDDLNDRLAQWGLQFAPDPASSNRATIGGAIGNNSTGAHSVRYGITDAYVDELTVILSNGEVVTVGEVVLDSPEWDDLVTGDGHEAAIYRTVRRVVEDNAAAIDDRYPELKRCVSGYNLNKVIYETDDGDRAINLAKLVVGAEGTLGVVVEATVSLVTRPTETVLGLFCYDDLIDALAAVPAALETGASAVEVLDEEVFRLAAESTEYAEYVEPIPEGTAAALMLEFDDEVTADPTGALDRASERLLADDSSRAPTGPGSAAAETADRTGAFAVIPAHDPADQADLWKLRKAAIPLLMSLEGDAKPYPFIEDATVPPGDLAEYVQAFQRILDDHDTSAAYFAHAGVGTLHIRPILSLKEDQGIETMHSIAEAVTDLVLERDGSFSGEHGDGLARTQFNPKMFGGDLWTAFKDVKTVFDPDWRMNPGKVVYRAEDPTDMREHLRYGADYASIEPQTELDFSTEGGFSHLVELCNGCGTCRQTGTDVMCPTYRASREEVQTTRGRANMLRAAISGDLPAEEMYSERFQAEVLDLCVGCKGCSSDCPTGVDLAKLKAEVKHQYHQREGASLRDRLFANVQLLATWGSRLAPLSNWAARVPGSRLVADRVLGIAPDRSLPAFSRETFAGWFAHRGPRVSTTDAHDEVVLFPDAFTNHTHPTVGKAAVRVLEAADVRVSVPPPRPTGRPAYSLGFLDLARRRARRVVEDLAPPVAAGQSVVFVEPSDAVMVQDEYLDLLSGQRVETVAANTYGLLEYLDLTRADERMAFGDTSAEYRDRLAYHGHCNQTAVGTDHHAVGVLRRAGYRVDPVEATCCGMAGSFGYESEHYALSTAIGSILAASLADSEADRVVAPGTSCRTQIDDVGTAAAEPPQHPVEILAEALS